MHLSGEGFGRVSHGFYNDGVFKVGEFGGSIILRSDGRTICGIVLLCGHFLLFLLLLFFLPSNLAAAAFRAMSAGSKSSFSMAATGDRHPQPQSSLKTVVVASWLVARRDRSWMDDCHYQFFRVSAMASGRKRRKSLRPKFGVTEK